MTTTAFGPQGPNYTTTRPPADPQASGGADTFFKNCSAAGAKDGTFATADFFNVNLGNLRYLCRTAGVTLSDADDTMVYNAVHNIAAAVAAASSSSGSNYAVDTGVVNALAVTLPSVSALTPGLVIYVKVKITSTAAATIAVNTLGTVNIIRGDASATAANDLNANEIVELIFDGTSFQLANLISRNFRTSRFAVFTTPGTVFWTCPADVSLVKARGGGGGGGGGGCFGAGAGAGGNGGAGVEGVYNVVPGTAYAVTIGTGGAAGAAGASGGTGGTTLFASFANAGGGGGGGGGSNGSGTTSTSGIASGGGINLPGVTGQYGAINTTIGLAQAGAGGSGPFGFAGPAFVPPCMGTTLTGYANNLGGGGSGAASLSGAGSTGGRGGDGFLILEY